MGAAPRSVTVGDFNGDGHHDLATANIDAATVSILLGQGDGTFQRRPGLCAWDRPRSVTVGDFNGDGHLDLAHREWRCPTSRFCWAKVMAPSPPLRALRWDRALSPSR